jgi:hypothetical protein
LYAVPSDLPPPAQRLYQHAVPTENVQIYSLLFAFETILRELTIDVLARRHGPRWYRTQLPPDAYEHYRSGINRDRSTRWTSNVPHHPVYYLTFPDLRATIELRENWAIDFREIFARNKEILSTDLAELEFIRNKVAHNRRASTPDFAIARAAYEKLLHQLGPLRAGDLMGRYTIATDIARQLLALQREAVVSFALASRRKRIRRLEHWSAAVERWWWFDDSYLGFSVGRVEQYFRQVSDSASDRDSLHEQTAGSPALTDLFARCRSDLDSIIAAWPRESSEDE